LDLGRLTIARILSEQGIEPAPLRRKTISWRTFLKAHWGAIAAADFYSVEVLTVGGFVRYLVLFESWIIARRKYYGASYPVLATCPIGKNSPACALLFMQPFDTHDEARRALATL